MADILDFEKDGSEARHKRREAKARRLRNAFKSARESWNGAAPKSRGKKRKGRK